MIRSNRDLAKSKALILAIAAICLSAVNISANDVTRLNEQQNIQIASLGDSKVAIDSVQDSNKAQNGHSESAKEHNDLGVTFSQQGQYDLALTEFNKAIEIDPLSADAYNNRGINYSKKDQYELAIADFSQSLKLTPDDVKVIYNRGITYALMGNENLAMSDLKRCIELSPNSPDVYELMGILQQEQACADWQQACELGNCVHIIEAKRLGVCSEKNLY